MRNIGTILGLCVFVLVLALVLWIWSRPERGTTGQVRTNFRWLGPNDLDRRAQGDGYVRLQTDEAIAIPHTASLVQAR